MLKRYSIFALMELTAVIAAALGADRMAIAMNDLDLMSDMGLLAGLVAIGGLIGAYAAFRLRPQNSVESTIKTARIAGAVATPLNAAVVLIVEADRLKVHGSDAEWFWLIIPILIVGLTIGGTALGMLMAMIPASLLSSSKING